jgi:flavin reductase (DIM6/NTAB) family NADH-FMN oxidoreductase RutF
MDIDPDALGLRERYRLLIGLIVPRPIAFVSTLSPDGHPNLAPFSFFNGIASSPLTLLFCPSNKPDGSEKDTLRNCKPPSEGGTGEFVVNASVESYARELTASAEELPYGESEFDLTGLATAPSSRVKPPRVALAPWSFECRTLQVLRLDPGRPSGGNVVIGQILAIHLDDSLVDSRLYVDPAKLAAVGRMGGISYCFTRQRYDLPPGRDALARPAPSPSAP